MDMTAKQRVAQGFFLGAFAFLLYQAFQILAPFLPALVVSATLALTVYPLHARLLARLRRPGPAAALTTALLSTLVFLPLSFGCWTLAREATRLYPEARQRLEALRDWEPSWQPGPAKKLWDRARPMLEGRKLHVRGFVADNLDEIGGRATRALGAILRNAALFAFYLAVVVVSLFFFLRDGPELVRGGLALLPMEASRKEAMLTRVSDVMNAVVLGILAAALLQGLLALAGLAFLGVPFPVLLAGICTLVSPIPFVGTALVWVPVALALALSGQVVKAGILAAWFLVVVGLADNLVRPLLIGSRVGFPLPLVFMGVIGGLAAFGPFGIFLGPIVIALVLAMAKFFKEDYQAP